MEFERLRNLMVKEQIIARGIKDRHVIQAVSAVPRHLFVRPQYKDSAYEDHPLPLGEGQTISQPYIVALMSEALNLDKEKNVLEIGTGSGYQTAILAELAKEVYSVERIAVLAEKARGVLDKLNYKNIKIKVGDGTSGWEEYAPYQAIIVTAATGQVPQALLDQLREQGKLIIPLGEGFVQDLTLFEKKKEGLASTVICGCRFVPLLGKPNG